MTNLDQILLQRAIMTSARTRQFRLRMDALKDQEQKTMWEFIHENLRKARAITKDKVEREYDVNPSNSIYET